MLHAEHAAGIVRKMEPDLHAEWFDAWPADPIKQATGQAARVLSET